MYTSKNHKLKEHYSHKELPHKEKQLTKAITLESAKDINSLQTLRQDKSERRKEINTTKMITSDNIIPKTINSKDFTRYT